MFLTVLAAVIAGLVIFFHPILAIVIVVGLVAIAVIIEIFQVIEDNKPSGE